MTHVGHSTSSGMPAEPSQGSPRAGVKDVVGAYVGLMKPRVIELLLLTTVPVMFFAARGIPPLGLVAATVVGGALDGAVTLVF